MIEILIPKQEKWQIERIKVHNGRRTKEEKKEKEGKSVCIYLTAAKHVYP